MKKKLFVFGTFIAFLSLIIFACKKEEDGLQVGYASDQGTGANPDNTTMGSTSSGSTTATSMTTGSTSSSTGSTTSTSSTSGSTTSTTSGTTTGSTTGSNFKLNSTVYNCATVTGGVSNGLWRAIGRTTAGDSCAVAFSAIPTAGSYTVTFGTPNATQCVVAVRTISPSNSYAVTSGGGSVVVTNMGGTSRKVVITNAPLIGSSTLLTATLTTP